MATPTSQLIEQLLPDNTTAQIDPADVRAVAHALDAQPPNQRRGGPFFVTFLSAGDASDAGQPTGSTLDQLDPALLCLGVTAQVQQHPAGAGVLMVLIPDGTGQGLVVARDGYFQTGATVRGRWVRLDSQAAAVANVPPYAANVVYAINYLVRYTPPGGFEAFYYALKAGKLPAPASTTTASWRLVPGPVPATMLAQFITLGQAQGLDGAGVVPGRRYGVTGTWNNAASPELVYLDGLENYFRRRGTLLRDDGTQQEVDVDVQASTYQVAAASGGGGAAVGRTFQLTGTSSAPYADLLLDVPAARLSTEEGWLNYGGLQVQVLAPTGSAFRPARDAVAAFNADLTDFWAQYGAGSRAVVRLRAVPLSQGLVAHGLLTFTLAPAGTPQLLHGHDTPFRLFGNQFTIGPVEWKYTAGSTITGGTILFNQDFDQSFGSSSPALSNTGTGQRIVVRFGGYSGGYYACLGLTSSPAQPTSGGSSFGPNLYINGGTQVQARTGSQSLAQMPYNGEGMELAVSDDGVRWTFADGTPLWYDPTPPPDLQYWVAAVGYRAGTKFSNVQAGAQATSPR